MPRCDAGAGLLNAHKVRSSSQSVRTARPSGPRGLAAALRTFDRFGAPRRCACHKLLLVDRGRKPIAPLAATVFEYLSARGRRVALAKAVRPCAALVVRLERAFHDHYLKGPRSLTRPRRPRQPFQLGGRNLYFWVLRVGTGTGTGTGQRNFPLCGWNLRFVVGAAGKGG